LVNDGPQRSSGWHDSVTISSQADRLKHLGSVTCHQFRKKILSRHEPIADFLADGYLQITRERDYVEANRNLHQIDKRLIIEDLNLSWPIERIKRFAEEKAATCSNVANRHHYTDKAFELCSNLVSLYGLKPPQMKDYGGDSYPCIKRMCSPDWWRRKVTKTQRRLIESVARDMGMVCQQRSAYASQVSQFERTKQKIRNLQYLESTFIENDEGQRYCLKELHDRSVSNPMIRRSELMTRIKGFEIVAEQLGHIGEFYTLTTPSRMHARLKRGIANPKYDGTTPDEAHQYLTGLFRCIRSKLHRQGLNVYGIRVVEPHHDGTPHWHLLLFMDKASKESVRSIFREYAFKADADEKGSRKHRFKAVAIDPQKGSAAGYVTKYVAKNIDGEHISEDLHGNDSKSVAKAIDAWASTYNIRQFQYIGGPSVTVWRELRRLSNSKQKDCINPIKQPALYNAMQAADAAEWAAFVMVMGGIGIKAKARPIRPLYSQEEEINLETGEINQEALTKYGDTKASKVIGLICNSIEVITRWRKWSLVTESGASHWPLATPEPCVMA